jgi:hypothetical protein
MPQDEERPSAFQSGKRLLVGGLLLTVLFWRGGAGVVEGVSELVRKAPDVAPGLVRPEDDRIRLAIEAYEDEYGYARGELVGLYRIFSTEVGEDHTVVAIARQRHPLRAGIARLNMISFPLRMENSARIPPGGPPNPELISEKTWLLDLELAPGTNLETWFDLVSQGEHYALWRGRPQP